MARTRTKGPKRDAVREDRIATEIVVDANDTDERALAWYSYLEEALEFPFSARCVSKRIISPLRVNDEVDVTGLPDFSECRHEMFVLIRWERDGLAVPLSQLQAITGTDDQTGEAVEDWRYWTLMGYDR